MNPIIGRHSQKKELEEAYQSNDAEFIAAYGRRRVGKTYLIRNFFQTQKGIYFQTTGIYRGAIAKQLAQFATELAATFYPGASIKTPENWMDAFDELTNAIAQMPQNKKIVLFFDELPWMATPKSGIISALEYFWNRHWANDSRIKLIVCGSSASWITKKIIKNRGGLHNRVTRKIKLLPFTLHETSLYLKYLGYPCTHQQIAKLYMVMGGVPFYLKNIKKNYSIDQNIDHLFFNSTGIFFDEFDEVFASLFENSERYQELVTLIASKKDGISRRIIDEATKLTGSGGRLTQRLDDLEQAGFITSYLPFGHKKLGLFYRISDEYCYFYLKWIAHIKPHLKQQQTTKYWSSLVNTPEYFSWQGYAFENICYKHIQQIKKTLAISEASLSSPWRYTPKKNSKESGAQIDSLFDRDDNAITLCEIKYSEQPFVLDKPYAHILKRKIDTFKKVTGTKKQIFLALISSCGVKKTIYSEELLSGVVTLDNLFAKS